MPDADDVVLRVAELDDVPFLAGVVFETNEKQQSAREDWDAQAFHQGLIEDATDQVSGGVEDSTTYVIERAGDRVGRLRLVRGPEALEVAGLQITGEAQGKGVGTGVLRGVQAEASAAGRAVVLDVDHDNASASRLYRRLGFMPGGSSRWPDRAQLVWTAEH